MKNEQLRQRIILDLLKRRGRVKRDPLSFNNYMLPRMAVVMIVALIVYWIGCLILR